MGSLPSLPPPSREFSVAGYRLYALFYHKNGSNWIECYNPSSNTWSYVSTIPGIMDNRALKDCAMVSLGDSIYIIGGRRCYPDKSAERIDAGMEVVSSVLCYNAGLGQWSECPPLNVGRYDFACVVWDNKIYVAGGKSNLTSGRGISSAEVYDPTINAWIPLPNMSTLRYKCVGVTWQGKIHVIGGFAVRAGSDKTEPFVWERSSGEVLDTQAGKWDLVAGMWQLDVPPNQIVTIDGSMFSSGDCFKPWKGHIESYDGKLGIWSVVDGSYSQTLDSPLSQRLYLTMAPIGSQLYFLVGYRVAGESSRTISIAHIFDTSAGEHAWRSMEPVEEDAEKELSSHCCVVQVS